MSKDLLPCEILLPDTSPYPQKYNKKSNFLGMDYGTAHRHLKKMILFELVKKVKQDICYRCGNKITEIKELSVEHKEPWMNVSAELFWNLDNIAFSHLKCNTPHSRAKVTSKRKIGPKGTAWCCKHKQFLPLENFGTSKRRWSNTQDYCKQCRSEMDLFYRPRKNTR